MDPGQDYVLSGLGDEHPEHCQNARHPKLDCSYGCLKEQMVSLIQSTLQDVKIQQTQFKVCFSVTNTHEISHHGRWDGKHTLEQHVYGSERGGRHSFKQSIQHS